MMRFLVLVFVAACAAEPEFEKLDLPHVNIFFNEGVAQPDRVVDGAELWGELGFTFSVEEPSGLVQCSNRWYERDSFGCELSILVSEDFPSDTPKWGHSIRAVRELAIRVDITDRNRQITSAHEFGHILLDLSNEEHLDRGGIMAVDDAFHHDRITDADRALAPWL